MSALTANANTVTILSESCDHVTLRLFLHQQTAGDQNSVLVMNASTLLGLTQTLTLNPGTVRFIPGEALHANGGSATQAKMCYSIGANTVLVTNLTGNVSFSSGDVVWGSFEGAQHANVTAVANAAPRLDIDSILWSVTGNGNTKVALEFANSSASESAISLSGSGYYGRNELDAPIKPTLAGYDGNLYVSTYGVPALGGYTITVVMRKVIGYAQPPIY